MNQKIGIWGLGIVGQASLNYYLRRQEEIVLQIMDQRDPTKSEVKFFLENNIEFVPQNKIEYFFEHNDIIVPSPGINISKYKKYYYKIVPELDLFCTDWKKKYIGITGTVGKTSTVHLFSHILEFFGKKVATGGNIGLGMLNLIEDQRKSDLALLELSSFQLEHSKLCAPDIAVWTNFYPNHLDRHQSLAEYFKAKAQILINQTENQYALIPLNLRTYLKQYMQEYKFKQNIVYFSLEINNINSLDLKSIDCIYFINEKQEIVKYHNNFETILINANNLPDVSYKNNWLILVALCDLLNLDYNKLKDIKFNLLKHRLELVKTINNISFYNDSKSTIPESTLEAINHLSNKPIHLFIGGISKGVDRQPFINTLKNKVETVYCFGKEAKMLRKFCNQADIKAFEFETLQEAIDICFKQAKQGDQILFSPSGASYDLFKDYQERGDVFKDLVNKFKN